MDGRKAPSASEDLVNIALGDDLLLNVVRRLYKAADKRRFGLVCKRWQKLHSTTCQKLYVLRAEATTFLPPRFPSVEELDFSLCAQVKDRELCLVTEALGPGLRSLNLANNRRITHIGLDSVGTHCPNLLRLQLVYGTFSDDGLKGIARCAKLQALSLVNCREVTDAGLAFVAEGCKDLQDLSLKWCIMVSDKGVCTLAKHCRHLVSLDLSYTQVSGESLQSVSSLPHLSHLSLVSCGNVNDNALAHLATLSSLKMLDLMTCEGVSDDGLATLARGSCRLHHLNVSYCRQMSDAFLSSLHRQPQLSTLKLDVCSITGVGLAALALAASSLLSLSLRRCGGVTDGGLASLLPFTPLLEHLDLTCCRAVTDTTLALVGRCNKKLRMLAAEGCTLLTDAGLVAVCAACDLEDLDLTECEVRDSGGQALSGCKNIRKLKLGFSIGLTSAGLACIGRGCARLENLDVYRCEGVGDDGIVAIAAGCPHLLNLNLSYCTAITDASLQAIAHHSHQLLNLEVRGCEKLTSVGLVALAAGCSSLRELDIKRCRQVGDMGVLAVAKCCVDLRQVNLSYCPVTDRALYAVSTLRCMGNMKLVHCSHVSELGMSKALLACKGLKKVKLLGIQRSTFAPQVWEKLESRGCKLRWMDKRDPERPLPTTAL